jgi:triacylglycerol lipase
VTLVATWKGLLRPSATSRPYPPPQEVPASGCTRDSCVLSTTPGMGIVPALESLPRPMFYAGHSLGAALATLAASRRAPDVVYAFGSPRLGNGADPASLATVPLYRVVDDADLVATLPPEALSIRHAGELHRLVPPKGLKFNLLRWLQGLLSPPRPLADHAPINYVDRIV